MIDATFEVKCDRAGCSNNLVTRLSKEEAARIDGGDIVDVLRGEGWLISEDRGAALCPEHSRTGIPKRPLFLVMGETGEHGDQRQWVVAGSHSKTVALRAVTDCHQIYLAELEKRGGSPSKAFVQMKREWKHVFDPDFDMDSNGTRYYLVQTILIGDPE